MSQELVRFGTGLFPLGRSPIQKIVVTILVFHGYRPRGRERTDGFLAENACELNSSARAIEMDSTAKIASAVLRLAILKLFWGGTAVLHTYRVWGAALTLTPFCEQDSCQVSVVWLNVKTLAGFISESEAFMH